MTYQHHIRAGHADLLLNRVILNDLEASKTHADLTGLFSVSSFQSRSIMAGNECWRLHASIGDTTLFNTAVVSIERGRLNANMTLTFIGDLTLEQNFWELVEKIASWLGANRIVVEQIKTEPGSIPIPPTQCETSRYTEQSLYVIDLLANPNRALFNSNTRRNIQKAEKAGITASASTQADAITDYLEMTGQSTSRRAKRGEGISGGSRERVEKFLNGGCGRIFLAKAAPEGQTVSAKVVYTTGSSAHYYDGGSSEEGMRCGASHYLLDNIVTTLRSEGVKHLNLGIANSKNLGLIRFKEGFNPNVWLVSRVEVQTRKASRTIRNIILSASRKLLNSQ